VPLSPNPPTQLANVLWACATLDWADPRAIARLADAAAARSGGFEPQALSNCAWALARLGAAPGAAPGAARPQAFEALAAAALPKARAFTAQGCANLLWAFATAGHPHPKLFDAIGGQVRGTAFRDPEGRAASCARGKLPDRRHGFGAVRQAAPGVSLCACRS
jgi:hypothetical protein